MLRARAPARPGPGLRATSIKLVTVTCEFQRRFSGLRGLSATIIIKLVTVTCEFQRRFYIFGFSFNFCSYFLFLRRSVGLHFKIKFKILVTNYL